MIKSRRRRTGQKVIKSGKKKIGLELLKPDIGLPRGYLSASQIEMYLRCPRQYQFRYIEERIAPPGVALTEGICHHEVMEFNNINKFDKGEDLNDGILKEKFKDEFATKKKHIPKSDWVFSGENVNTINERGDKFIENYLFDVAPNIQPTKLPESKFEIELGGVPILGFIDLEQDKSVVDYKVVKQARTQHEVDNDIQLTLYSFATRKKSVQFCCFTKTKTAAIKNVTSIRGNNDYAYADALIGSVAEGIKSGNFPMCNPNKSFPCSERYCGYYKMCRGVFNK